MDDILLRSRLNRPLITGTPSMQAPKPTTSNEAPQGDSFQKVLQDRLSQAQKQTPSFSRHAVNRMEERGIPLTDATVSRIQEGMELAQKKGLDDALIIMDQAAFIVSAKSGAVITALGGNELKNSVITNINGTVIL